MSGFRKLFRSALVTFQVIALVVMPFSAAYASETLNYDTDIMTGSSEDFDSSQFEGQESGPSVSSSPSNSEINESMNSEEDEDDLQNVNSEPSISVDSSTDDNDSETSENDDAPSLDEKRNESVSTEPTSTGGSADEPLLKAEIQAHVSKVGWTQFEDCSKYVGVTDGSNYLEAFRVILPSEVDGSIEARVHVAKIGWQDWIGLDVDSFAGTTGNALAIEAVQLRLSGDIASEYDVWYRVYSENIGWSGWANDGSSAGTQGYGIAAQAIEIRFIEKGKPAPGETESAFKAPYVTYQAHSQTIGWQEYLNDGETAGTTGRALRLEALNISLGPAAGEGGIEARAHVAKEGWQDWTAGTIGTTGKKLAIEALQIRLTGDAASKYDVWYRVHSQTFGWTGWASNGASVGSQCYGKRAEAVEIQILPKGSAAPGETENPFYAPTVSYSAHIQSTGWVSSTTTDTAPEIILGDAGSGKRLEAIMLSIPNLGGGGSISYSAHVQHIGWQDDVCDSEIAGTVGMGYSVEAVKISLSGTISENYDVWYRVYVRNIGWLGWASNGVPAGSEGLNGVVESLEIVFLPKGSDAPGSVSSPFITTPAITSAVHINGANWLDPVGLWETSGTTGQRLNIDIIRLACEANESVSGSVVYRVRPKGANWQEWVDSGESAGTAGVPIEAVQIKLEGDYVNYFDVYYRVHVDSAGWLGWAENGASSGTDSCGFGIQAIEIVVKAKGADAPGGTSFSYCSGVLELPYVGYQTPGSYYKVSHRSVSIKNQGQGQFGFRTESRIPFNASREDCVNAMITRAMEYLGTPYRWDYSCEPGVGVDCAGLVMQGLYATGMDISPMNPWDHYYTPGHDHYANDMRNSSRFMHVSFSQRQRGDLICWNGHIAIYLGNDQIIEATPPRVRIASVYSYGTILAVLRPFP